MSKKTKKLSLKKETLRTLSAEQLGEVAGGTTQCLSIGGVRPPPPGTFGCETDALKIYNFQLIKY